MTRRGLTLIELLLALALLGTILVVAVSWTRVVARSGIELLEPARWEREAHRALDLIADDLAIADAAPTRRRAPARVVVRADDLVITTRNALGPRRGTVEHRYHRAAARGELVLEEREPGATAPARRLLGGVTRWRCRIDAGAGTLEVTLGAGDRTVARRYPLP